MVAKMMDSQLGKRDPPGPTRQREPDVCTHIESLLPIGSPSRVGWRLLPEMSTHFGSLPPWLQR